MVWLTKKLKKEGGFVYHIRYNNLDGKTRAISTKTDNEELARKILKKFQEDLIMKEFGIKDSTSYDQYLSFEEYVKTQRQVYIGEKSQFTKDIKKVISHIEDLSNKIKPLNERKMSLQKKIQEIDDKLTYPLNSFLDYSLCVSEIFSKRDKDLKKVKYIEEGGLEKDLEKIPEEFREDHKESFVKDMEEVKKRLEGKIKIDYYTEQQPHNRKIKLIFHLPTPYLDIKSKKNYIFGLYDEFSKVVTKLGGEESKEKAYPTFKFIKTKKGLIKLNTRIEKSIEKLKINLYKKYNIDLNLFTTDPLKTKSSQVRKRKFKGEHGELIQQLLDTGEGKYTIDNKEEDVMTGEKIRELINANNKQQFTAFLRKNNLKKVAKLRGFLSIYPTKDVYSVLPGNDNVETKGSSEILKKNTT